MLRDAGASETESPLVAAAGMFDSVRPTSTVGVTRPPLSRGVESVRRGTSSGCAGLGVGAASAVRRTGDGPSPVAFVEGDASDMNPEPASLETGALAATSGLRIIAASAGAATAWTLCVSGCWSAACVPVSAAALPGISGVVADVGGSATVERRTVVFVASALGAISTDESAVASMPGTVPTGGGVGTCPSRGCSAVRGTAAPEADARCAGAAVPAASGIGGIAGGRAAALPESGSSGEFVVGLVAAETAGTGPGISGVAIVLSGTSAVAARRSAAGGLGVGADMSGAGRAGEGDSWACELTD